MALRWSGRAALGLALTVAANQASVAPAPHVKAPRPEASATTAPAAANNGPSLAETTDWIALQVKKMGGYSHTTKLEGQYLGEDSMEFLSEDMSYEKFSFSGCTLTVHLKWNYWHEHNVYGDNGKIYRYDDEGNKSEVRDPNAPTEIHDREIDDEYELGSYSTRISVVEKSYKYAGNPDLDLRSWDPETLDIDNFEGISAITHFEVNFARTDGQADRSLYFRDKDIAERVAKALSHAIELCGGKAEPF